MNASDHPTYSVVRPPRTLDVFLLSRVELSAAIGLQQQFAKDVLQPADHRGVLLLCELAPVWSAGTAAVDWTLREALPRESRDAVAVPRAGGLFEHGPAQLAVLPVFSLEQLEQTPGGFTQTLEQMLATVCEQAGATDVTREPGIGIRCRTGWLARTGLQFVQELSQFGCYLNVGQTYELFPGEKSSSLAAATMQHKDLAAIKSLLLDEFTRWLPATRQQIFTQHPLLKRTWR